MLIVPLHRALTRANFPFVTLALVAINCFVFLFLQSGDTQIERRAMAYYEQTDLGKIESPAYIEWLRAHSEHDPQRLEAAQSGPPRLRIALIESDAKFLDALHAGKIIAPDDPRYADWHAHRTEFERIRDSAFTNSHELRFSHIEPGRMFTAMFLHGSLDHLIGNMIFLAVLGLLVEGALGALGYLGLYLLGGIGGQLLSLAWHWGDGGAALGASGAIAALMGAYCVLWGTRKVRVFWWFFVVFDYVRVPALVLLPFWLGWQVLNLLLDHTSHIGFDAHAGGILAGAGLAFALKRNGRVREDFIAEDERHEQKESNAAAFENALQLIGRLETTQARTILARIDAQEPGQLKVLVALYRCARYGGKPQELDDAAARVLAFEAKGADVVAQVKPVCEDYCKACANQPRLAPDLLLRTSSLMLRFSQVDTAEILLRGASARAPELPGLAAAWFALALRTPEGAPQRRARLEYVLARYPASELAPKAKFLLQQV